MNARKEDTRRKIQLGGLVIKSGLSNESEAVILGVLSLAANALIKDESGTTRARFQAAGDSRFKEDSHAK